MRRGIADKAARLKTENRPLLRELQCQMAQVQYIAEHTRDHEQRCCARRLNTVERYHVGETVLCRRRGLGRACLIRAGSVDDPGRAFCDCRGFKQDRDRELDTEFSFYRREQAHGDQGVSTQVEETVIHPHR